jgi:hypothetical protein
MSTPFLLGFAQALVHVLVARSWIEVSPGSGEAVVRYLAEWLETQGKGRSLVSTTMKGLFSCPDVIEVYLDDDVLKDVIDHLVVGE